MKKLATVITLFSLHSILAVGASIYHVTTNGLDDISRDGLSQTSSWRSIAYAMQFSASGDVINVGAGEYIESLTISTPITINGTNSYDGSRPPLSRHNSSTVIKPYYTNNTSFAMVLAALTNGITIQNLTIEGDVDSDGVPDVMYGIYSTNKPLNVNHCIIRNTGGFGIAFSGSSPPDSINDGDDVRSYFGYNLMTNITSTNAETATALYLHLAPATCEYNEIADIRGTNSNAAIYANNCKHTIKTANWLSIRGNYFRQCTTAIRATQFSAPGEKIIISDNLIEDGIIGIRVTAAEAQSIISNNFISVWGVSDSTNATPARGLWIHGDSNPWGIADPTMQTDHLVTSNTILNAFPGISNTIGMCFTYDRSATSSMNNGVRATVLNNSISGFDYGAYVASGTNGVSISHDPLVRIFFRTNDLADSASYGLFATGTTEMVDATTNWWGYYFGPTGTYGSAVSTNILFTGFPLGAFLLDTDNDGTNDWMDTDDDGDTLLDTNEMVIGTHPAKWDTDGDGAGDHHELGAGTDPTNALSVFKFSTIYFGAGTGIPEVKWYSVTGKKYSVYRTANMLGGFTLLSNNIAAGFPAENVYTDSTASGSSRYFYRVTVTN